MTTSEINATRLDLFSGPGTSALETTIRERLREQHRRRIIAISQQFVVTAPVASDPAVERWVAEGSQTCGCQWTGDYSSVEPAEKVGEDISRRPFLY